MKTLVVYYSRKGYTEKAAVKAAKENDADLLCIETTENTAGYDGFLNCLNLCFSKKGVTLFPYEEDISSYDKIIVCSPVWCGALSAPMREFLTRERHHIDKAEYIFLHCLPGSVDAVKNEANAILRLESEKTTAVQCIFGHIINEKII